MREPKVVFGIVFQLVFSILILEKENHVFNVMFLKVKMRLVVYFKIVDENNENVFSCLFEKVRIVRVKNYLIIF